MTDAALLAIADKFHIRELIDTYSNLCTRKETDGLGALFTEDCRWRTTGTTVREFVGRAAVVQAIAGVVQSYPMIFQMPHAPLIELDGDKATATTLLHEIGKLPDGSTAFMAAVYHDSFVRTDEGWRFQDRLFEGLHREAGAR